MKLKATFVGTISYKQANDLSESCNVWSLYCNMDKGIGRKGVYKDRPRDALKSK
jgi:hypothetical protein